MSPNPLAEMRRLREEIRLREEAIKSLESNPQLQADIAFEREATGLLSKYGKTLAELVAMLDPSMVLAPAERVKRPRGPNKPRPDGHVPKPRYSENTVWLIVTNPHNGEKVRTANVMLQKKCKEWIGVYGRDTVMSWVQPEVAAA